MRSFLFGVLCKKENKMILEKETVEVFNYLPSDLSFGSHKKIIVKCDYCGKNFEQTMKCNTTGRKKFNKDACWDCRGKKKDEMSLLKYGVKNPFQRKDIKEKIKNTNKEKYGVEHYAQTDEFKTKYKKVMLEKYGVEHSMQSEVIREKAKKTNLVKYGTEYVSQSPKVRQKAKKTNLEKYGAESFFNSQQYKEKMDEYHKERGITNVFQLEDVKQKMKETHLKKRGVTHHMKIKEVAQKAIEKGVQTKIKQGKVKIFRQKTITEWANFAGYSRSRFHTLIKQYGFEQAIKMTPHISYLESIFKDWFDLEGIEYKTHFKVDKYYSDFYLPKNNLIIELDGLYWHSEAINKDCMYHINKKNKYIEGGYNSVFFREDEINNKLNIIKSMVLNKCGLSNKIFARKCQIEVGTSGFIDDNHLMGKGRGDIFSLFHNNNEVCSLQIVRKEKNNYEISRFCTKQNYYVVGGFSKLLKYYCDKIKPDSIFTFMDKRYGGEGKYLIDLGFVYQHTYPSFKWTDSYQTFHRLTFPGNSGYEKGFVKIWDCGQAKYILQIANVK